LNVTERLLCGQLEEVVIPLGWTIAIIQYLMHMVYVRGDGVISQLERTEIVTVSTNEHVSEPPRERVEKFGTMYGHYSISGEFVAKDGSPKNAITLSELERNFTLNISS
jgi:hypothetical protein